MSAYGHGKQSEYVSHTITICLNTYYMLGTAVIWVWKWGAGLGAPMVPHLSYAGSTGKYSNAAASHDTVSFSLL